MGFLMECQNTIKTLKINKNKTIGDVIVIVEGESEEFKLLKHIFVDIFDYNYYSLKRNKGITDIFKSKTNKNSTLIVANTSSSSMKSIFSDKDFEDKIYNMLYNDYKKSLKNVPIFILWDRDRESNTYEMANNGIESFRNSLDNEYRMNGLFLISYPCIESYELSNFDNRLYYKKFKSSLDAKLEKKTNAKKYSLTNITESTLLNAAVNMHKSLLKFNIKRYDPSNFYQINKNIFKSEEKLYNDKKYYKALSLITVMLVDLGIITEE